ncbi:MAG: hypothetical protein DRN71_05170 [Candidatus Nanohalarchaeota archaeon]|nr:MAG: hypothetical protein DRN71_05170 [Candidatus Nanohaloarchaeota archaeon]
MNKMTIVLMALLVAVLFVSGCADKDAGGADDTTAVGDDAAPADPATDEKDTLGGEVSEDIDEVESTSTELEDEDVENLDKEFENIDW